MKTVAKNGEILSPCTNPSDAVPKNSVLMLGYFDGFHIGHMQLLNEALRLKTEYSAPCVAIWTFEHMSKGEGKYLTDNNEKCEAFFSCVPDEKAYVIFESYDELRDYSCERFVSEVLKKQFSPCAIVCGFNFRFGRFGAGDASLLKKLCAENGMECSVVPEYRNGDMVVSSTRIRALIADGDMETAELLTGRPYTVKGEVLSGRHIGHTIGFPTANLRIPQFKVSPPNGIYASEVVYEGKRYCGVSNIGYCPTVNSDRNDITLETNIVDFSGDLYGKTISVSLFRKLRDERRFDSKEQLSMQINSDREHSIEYYNNRFRSEKGREK